MIDSNAIVTFVVDAATAEEACRKVVAFQEGSFGEARAVIVDADVDLDQIRLRTVSTRLEPAVVEAGGLSGSGIVEEVRPVVDPEHQSVICAADDNELRALVADLRACAEGDSNDDEIDAAIALADRVEALLMK